MNHAKRKLLKGLSISFFLMAALTIVPFVAVSQVGTLGYKSLCPFAPFSTIISFYLALTILRYLRNIKDLWTHRRSC